MLGKPITPSRACYFEDGISVAGSRISAPSGLKAVAYPVPGVGTSVYKSAIIAKAKDVLMSLYGKDWKSADIEGKGRNRQRPNGGRLVSWLCNCDIIDHGRTWLLQCINF